MTQLRLAASLARQEHQIGRGCLEFGDHPLDHLCVQQPVARDDKHRAVVVQASQDRGPLLGRVAGAALFSLVGEDDPFVGVTNRFDDLPGQRADDHDVLFDAALFVDVNGAVDGGATVNLEADLVPVGRAHARALAPGEDNADDGIHGFPYPQALWIFSMAATMSSMSIFSPNRAYWKSQKL